MLRGRKKASGGTGRPTGAGAGRAAGRCLRRPVSRGPGTSAQHDAAAPVATASSCTVRAILAAEPPGGCRQRAEPVAEDGGAHPNEREMTAQAAATGGDTIPQHGHGEHEEESNGIVVLQWRAGRHGACMGNSRAQGGARRGNLYGHSR